MVGSIFDSSISALIAALATAFGTYLVYKRNTKKDARQARIEMGEHGIKRERAVSEMWAEYADRMERRLDRADQDLYMIKKELVDLQVQASLCKNEVQVLKTKLREAGINHDD